MNTALELDLPAQATMVAALRQALARQGGGEAALRETHISWVLLAGERAYKLKKALRTSFLDASRLALRHALGLEEVRLNRRLAPSLYLGLWPVTGAPQAPQLAPVAADGERVLDWAVVMRAFDEAGLWQRLAPRGDLPASAVDDLAQQLAAFQAAAPAAPAGNQWGTPEQVSATQAATRADLQRLLAGRPEAALLAPLAAWQAAQARALAPRLAERQAGGFVREGHGDLHLGNVVQLDGRACAFDGIDFDPALRWIHTVDDIAFLAMDLHAWGQAGLAHRFISAWVDASGDAEGLALLDFFQVGRALVRAMVALMRAVQPGEAGGAGEAQDRALARRYLDLAQTLALGPRRPAALVLMHGPSGSGKSTLALAVVQALGAVRLRSDRLRRSLPGPQRYDAAATEAVYQRLLALARPVLGSGRSAVLDATFLQRAPREAAAALARECGVALCIVDLHADAPLLRQRLRQRRAAGTDLSEADESVLEAQMKSAQALSSAERALALPGPAADEADLGPWLARLQQRLQASSSGSSSDAGRVPVAKPFSSA